MRFQKILDAQGKTLQEVAKLAGLSIAIVSKIHRGDIAGTKWDTVCRLCYVLGKRPEEMLEGFRLPPPPRIRTRRKRKAYTSRRVPVQQAAERASA